MTAPWMAPVTEFSLQLAAMADRYESPVCTTRDIRDWWTSEDVDERELATAYCRDCPVAAACLAEGRRIRATVGVWGGVDLGAGQGRPRAKPRAGRRERTIHDCPPAHEGG